MAEQNRVWVKTAVLDEIVYGKSKGLRRRAVPDENTSNGDAPESRYSWAHATIVQDEDAVPSTSAKVKKDADPFENDVTLCIIDSNSPHERENITIPPGMAKDGIVLDNDWIDAESDDEDSDDEGFKVERGPPSDLIGLTHLHEPAVVNCLKFRMRYDDIYTSTGPILLAVNPFRRINSLYNDATMNLYWKRGEMRAISDGSASPDSAQERKEGDLTEEELEALPPHVFAIADNAFRAMMKKLKEKEDMGGRRAPAGEKGADQAILVSGESGAGKTVTTKFVMKYLASLSSRKAKNNKEKEKVEEKGEKKQTIEDQVLQSNPILESFGNARTIRNDNSSRFGKFIEMQFSREGTLIGASIQTYLLEKVRLVQQAPGERNYHALYEMLAGFTEDQLDKYFLSDYTAEDFKMTSNSGTYDRRDGVEDFDTFGELKEAMDEMGFEVELQDNIFAIAISCLHASNIEFLELIHGESSEIEEDSPHTEAVLKLLGVTYEGMNSALCSFKIKAGKETHVRALPKEKAEKGVEALIKATYGALFLYLVGRVNSCITVKEGGGGGRGKKAVKKAGFIGVLDIFGFESFKHNSFEQLCINYCNEALQQQFNLFVLKNEQDEYEREGIQWNFISFPENADVLELISKKGSGIISILDDQCRAPGTTDKSFANALYKKCTSHERFEANHRQVGALKFGIFHYAGPVEYDTTGFIEKNRDELPREATELLLSSTNDFVKTLAQIISNPDGDITAIVAGGGAGASKPKERKKPPGPGGAKAKAMSVGGQFSQQLTELRVNIDRTSPHYVRCMKPNDQLVPDVFDEAIIAEQLTCAGVIEAVRVSRVGYPQRYSHVNFVKRYKILGLPELKKHSKGSNKKIKPCDVLVDAIVRQINEIDPPSEEVMEKMEEDKANDKKCKNPKNYELSVFGLQVGKSKVFLRKVAYDMIERLRVRKMHAEAMNIQKAARKYIAMRELGLAIAATKKLQSQARRMKAKAKVQVLRENFSSTIIQAWVRRHSDHKQFLATKYALRWMQRVHRGLQGRKKWIALNKIRKSIIIQKYWRMHIGYNVYEAKKRSWNTLQRAVRCHWARLVLKELKKNAKNVNALGEERDKLRQENARLKQELSEGRKKAREEAKKEIAAAKEAAQAAAAERNEAKMAKVQKELVDVQSQLETVKLSLTVEVEKVKKFQKESEQSNATIKDIKAEIEKFTSELKTSKEETAAEVKKTQQMTNDIDNLKSEAKSNEEAAATALSTIQTDKAEKEQQIGELESELDEINERLSKSEKLNSDANGELESRNVEVENMRKELEEAQSAASTAEEQAEEARGEAEEARQGAEEARQEADESRKEAEDSREEARKARVEADDGCASAAEATKKMEEAQQACAVAEEQARSSDEALQKIANDSSAATKALADASSAKIATLQIEIDGLREKAAELEILRGEHETLKTSSEAQKLNSEERESTLIKGKDELESSLKKEREEVEMTLKKDMEEMEATLKKEKDELEATLKEERDQMESALKNEKEDIKASLEKEKEELEITLTKEKDELESRLSEGKEELKSNLEKENEELKTTLEKEKEDLKTTLEKENEDIKSTLEREMEELKSMLGNEQEELKSTLAKENEELKSTLENEIEEIKANFGKEKEEFEESQVKLNKERDELDAAHTELKKEYAELKEENDGLEANKIILEKENDELSKEGEVSNKEGGELKKETEELRKECDELEKESAALKKENEDVKKEIDEVKEESEEVKQESEELKRENEELKKAGEESKKESEELREDGEELRKLSEELKKKSEELKKDSDEFKKDSEEWKKESEEMMKESEELKKEIEDLKKGGEELKKEGEELKKEGEELKKEGEELKKESEELKDETEQLKDETEQLKEETEQLKEETGEFKKEREELVKEKEELNKINEELKKENEELDKEKIELTVLLDDAKKAAINAPYIHPQSSIGSQSVQQQPNGQSNPSMNAIQPQQPYGQQNPMINGQQPNGQQNPMTNGQPNGQNPMVNGQQLNGQQNPMMNSQHPNGQQIPTMIGQQPNSQQNSMMNDQAHNGQQNPMMNGQQLNEQTNPILNGQQNLIMNGQHPQQTHVQQNPMMNGQQSNEQQNPMMNTHFNEQQNPMANGQHLNAQQNSMMNNQHPNGQQNSTMNDQQPQQSYGQQSPMMNGQQQLNGQQNPVMKGQQSQQPYEQQSSIMNFQQPQQSYGQQHPMINGQQSQQSYGQQHNGQQNQAMNAQQHHGQQNPMMNGQQANGEHNHMMNGQHTFGQQNTVMNGQQTYGQPNSPMNSQQSNTPLSPQMNGQHQPYGQSSSNPNSQQSYQPQGGMINAQQQNGPMNPSSQQYATSNNEALLRQENEKLKLSLESLQVEADEMRAALDEVQRVASSTVKESLMDFESAHFEMEKVKQEIEEMSRRSAFQEPRMTYDQPSMATTSTVLASEEINKLRDENSRLQSEISMISGEHGSNSPGMLTKRYSELQRLSDANVQKDIDIGKLQAEIKKMRQSRVVDDSYNKPSTAHLFDDDDTSTLGFADVTMRDIDPASISNKKKTFAQRLQFNSHRGLNPSLDMVRPTEDYDAIQAVNDMLRKEVDHLKVENKDLKQQLKKEREKSSHDLAAFSQALKGVDEMRSAAEQMSKELRKERKKAKALKHRFGGGETVTDFWVKENNLDAVSVVSASTMNFDRARNRIDSSSVSVKSGKHEKSSNNIWSNVSKQLSSLMVVRESPPGEE